MEKIHLAAVLLGAFVVGVFCQTAQQTCLPDCTGKPVGSMVADPKNCTQFYYCLSGGEPSHVVWCGAGNYFDESLQKCVPGSCDPLCPPPSCHFTCNGTYDIIRDPSDCTKYYYCLVSGVIEVNCPSDRPHFDGNDCVNNIDVCCTDVCTPYCEAEGMQVPDPHDCTMYYVCKGVGEPSDFHFKCDEGENFNIATGRCDSNAPCQTSCSSSASTTASPLTSKPSNQTPVSSAPPTTTQALSSSSTAPSSSTSPTSPQSSTTPISSPSSSLSQLSTTATSPSPVSTTVETTTAGCRDTLYCSTLGAFPKCPSTCQKDYFICTETEQYAGEYTCTGILVFSPDPAYPCCIQPTDCPYTPALEY